ncbi:MAG TPA: hypothetical protein PLH09_08575 [Lentimicrobium sp.]|nr:hypothetical protein [Lentimicrobium sp.]
MLSGLIRSLGGWDEVKKMKLSGQDRIKSDQRILGDSDFVMDVLSESEERFSRKYLLKSRGYNFEKVAERVSSLFDLEKDYIIGRGRQRDRVRPRDILCYWIPYPAALVGNDEEDCIPVIGSISRKGCASLIKSEKSLFLFKGEVFFLDLSLNLIASLNPTVAIQSYFFFSE